jgi:hypothetical protein
MINKRVIYPVKNLNAAKKDVGFLKGFIPSVINK